MIYDDKGYYDSLTLVFFMLQYAMDVKWKMIGNKKNAIKIRNW